MNVDPTGKSLIGCLVLLIIGIVASGVINGVVAGANAAEGESFWSAFAGGFVNGVISGIGLAVGLAVAVGGGIGALVVGGIIAAGFGFAGGVAGSAVTQKITQPYPTIRIRLRMVNAVKRILGIRQSFAYAVEHFVIGDKLVCDRKSNLIYYFKFGIEKLTHSEFIRRRQQERFKENNHNSCFFKLFKQFFQIFFKLCKVKSFICFKLVNRVVDTYHYDYGVGL